MSRSKRARFYPPAVSPDRFCGKCLAPLGGARFCSACYAGLLHSRWAIPPVRQRKMPIQILVVLLVLAAMAAAGLWGLTSIPIPSPPGAPKGARHLSLPCVVRCAGGGAAHRR